MLIMCMFNTYRWNTSAVWQCWTRYTFPLAETGKLITKLDRKTTSLTTLLAKHSRKPNASTVATIWFLISRSFAATIPLLLSFVFSLPWRVKTTHFESFLVAVISLPKFSRWPRRKRTASRVCGVLFPSIPMATNLPLRVLLGVKLPKMSRACCPLLLNCWWKTAQVQL